MKKPMKAGAKAARGLRQAVMAAAASQAAQPPSPAGPSGSPSPMGALGPGQVAMKKGGSVNQHKRMAMGEKVTGMKRGGRAC